MDVRQQRLLPKREVFPSMKENVLPFDVPLTQYVLPEGGLVGEDHLVFWQKNSGWVFGYWYMLDLFGRSRRVPLVAYSSLTATALSLVCRAWMCVGGPSGSTSPFTHTCLWLDLLSVIKGRDCWGNW